jgi:hypothetical protein
MACNARAAPNWAYIFQERQWYRPQATQQKGLKVRRGGGNCWDGLTRGERRLTVKEDGEEGGDFLTVKKDREGPLRADQERRDGVVTVREGERGC